MPIPLLVGDWLVEPELNQIRNGERIVRLESRSIEVLVCLASRPGEVVEKAVILDHVWGDQHVTDEVLTHAIWELRKALGDDARQPSFIRTMPRRGYVLIAPVSRPVDDAASESLPVEAAGRPWWRPWWRSVALLAATLLLAVAASWFASSMSTPAPDSAAVQRLMVAPFDVQAGGDRPPVAVVITGELTRLLGELEGVEVVGRSFAERHRSTDLERLHDRLDVHFIVQGSISWFDQSTDRPWLWISIELVRSSDGAQIWSSSYKRVFDDVTPLLVDITESVAHELSIKLGISQAHVAANSAYLTALQRKANPAYEEDSRIEAIQFLERAVRLSPDFVAAWAELAKTHAEIAFNTQPTPIRRRQAQAALDRAVELAPDDPEVRVASAFVEYHAWRRFDAAKKSFEALARELPNDASVLRGLGYVNRRLGDLDTAIRHMQAAEALAPDAELSGFLAETFRAQRRWSEADRYYKQVRDQAPGSMVMWGESAMNRFDLTGSADGARDLLTTYPVSKEPSMLYYWLPLDLYAGDFHAAIDRYAHWEKSDEPIDRIRNPWMVALAAESLGRHDLALNLIDESRQYLEQFVSERPSYAYAHGYLALVHAFEGRALAARRSMAEATRLVAEDGFTGPKMRELEAMMHVLLGEPGRAVAILEELMERSYQHPISTARLVHEPIWQPLRSRADFSALIESEAETWSAVSP